MSLKLNYDAERKVTFEVYEGRNVDRMPDLVKDGRIPMSSRAIMRRRLDVLNRKAETPQEEKANEKMKDSWLNNYVDTGDAVFYHPDGGVKIVLDAPIMRELTSESPLIAGTLKLGEIKDESVARYEALDVPELQRKDLGTLRKSLTLAQAKNHPTWKILADGDQGLLNDYMTAIFNFYNISEGAAVYFDDARKVAHGRLWCLGYNYYDSNAFGNDNLDDGDGRLVGVAPEAHVGNVPQSGAHENSKPVEVTLEQRVQHALKAGKSFEYNGTVYVPVADKGVLLGK